MIPRTMLLTIVFAASLSACSRREALPGDSVPPDGGTVAVAPPRVAAAESPATRPERAREPLGVIESRVFPPELIMEHQAAIALDEKQRAFIMGEAERAQKDMRTVRWDLEREREALAKLLDAEPLDEQKIASSAAKLTELESRIKSVHLAMLVRVKKNLTATQRRTLAELR